MQCRAPRSASSSSLRLSLFVFSHRRSCTLTAHPSYPSTLVTRERRYLIARREKHTLDEVAMARIEDFRVGDRTWVAGDHFYNLWKKEVGDSRLPEILRSGVRGMRRFLDATTNAYVRRGNDAQCNDKVYKPSNSDAYYTGSTQYESNTSRRRQLHSRKGQLCVGNATASQDFAEGIRPVREYRNS